MQQALLASQSGVTHRLIVSFLINAGILAAFVLTLLSIGGANIGAIEPPVYFGSALIVMMSGELLLRFAGLDALPARAPVAIVIGATATSMAVLVGALLTGFRAGPVFLGWAAIVATALVSTRHRVSWRGRTDDFLDCVVVAVLALLVAFWCRHAAAAFPTLKANGTLPIWIDYYIHGTTIAQFGSALAAAQGAIDLAGQPIAFYHYGSFMLAAALEAVTDLPSLGLASAILLPLGLFIAALGTYSLATALAGPSAGAIAIAFLVLLPDASHYGLANGFFGFHWLLFTAPGSGYALGVVAVALTLTNDWLRRRDGRALALAVVLIAAVFQLRALFLPVLLPAFVLLLLCDMSFVRRHAKRIAWLAIFLAALIIALLLVVPVLNSFWLEHSVVARFLELTHHRGSHPTPYGDFYASHIASVGKSAAVSLGIIILIPVLLGVFALLYPLALAVWIRRVGWRVLDFFPLLLLLTYFTVVLFAPAAPNGNDNEYQHRPFVMLYQIVAIWTAAYLCQLIVGPAKVASHTIAPYALIAVAVASILTGWLTDHEPARPKFDWGKGYFRVAVAAGVLDAAAFVRRAARPGDIVAVVPIDEKATLTDYAIEMVSLTDAPSYLSHPGILIIRGGDRREAAIKRISELAEVNASPNPQAAFARLREIGVSWYVRIGADGPRFDPAKGQAAFTTANAAVYRIEPAKSSGNP